jgi:hypothetical protein
MEFLYFYRKQPVKDTGNKRREMKLLKLKLAVLLQVITFFSFAQGEFIIGIDRTTGTYVKTGPAIPGVTYIYPDDRAFDEGTSTFIFPGSLVSHRLYSIDVTNGATVNNPAINNILYFQFDNASGILYGLEQDNTNNVKNFIVINPATGTYTPLGTAIPGSSLYSGSYSAYDKLHHIYYFLDPPDNLYAIDAVSGTVLSSHLLSLLSGSESIQHFTVDNTTGTLYGLLQDNTTYTYFLVTIDPPTGTVTRIGAGTLAGSGNGSSAIDEANHQYVYLYSASGMYGIVTLDLLTGNMLYSNTIPLAINDNVFSLQCNNVTGKLYSIHWDDNIVTTGVSESTTPGSTRISPNPFYADAVLTAPECMKDASLLIFSITGQLVKKVQHISGQEVKLTREGLEAGLYYYRLMEDNTLLGADKNGSYGLRGVIY